MRILIIEDERKIREYLRDNLKLEFYEVDAVDSGERGLELIKLNDYAAVVLDNVLPKKSGLEVCSEVRALGITTPIIILSVLSRPLQKTALLNAGADDYLAKPFSYKELQARIAALVRRPKQIQQEVLHIQDIEMNTTTHEVMKAGESISLTRKEFMLLRYFIHNKNIVLSRTMIIDHVWDMSADPFSNTIEAHIVSLRRKIGDKKQGIIKTVSGRGYKIID
jgi:DNA-binding response OmpR family regulator